MDRRHRNLARYAAWADRALPDAEPGFHGPLEGIATALCECPHDWALFAPSTCRRCRATWAGGWATRHAIEAARSRSPTTGSAAGPVLLARPRLAASARARRLQGDAAVHAWQDACGALEVDCTPAADGSFDNLNHLPA